MTHTGAPWDAGHTGIGLRSCATTPVPSCVLSARPQCEHVTNQVSSVTWKQGWNRSSPSTAAQPESSLFFESETRKDLGYTQGPWCTDVSSRSEESIADCPDSLSQSERLGGGWCPGSLPVHCLPRIGHVAITHFLITPLDHAGQGVTSRKVMKRRLHSSNSL